MRGLSRRSLFALPAMALAAGVSAPGRREGMLPDSWAAGRMTTSDARRMESLEPLRIEIQANSEMCRALEQAAEALRRAGREIDWRATEALAERDRLSGYVGG